MGPVTPSATPTDNVNRAKIANIVEVCNVSAEEAARVLEACHQDAAVAIDRFLSGLESGWSEVSTKKKKPAAGAGANGGDENIGSSAGKRGGYGGAHSGADRADRGGGDRTDRGGDRVERGPADHRGSDRSGGERGDRGDRGDRRTDRGGDRGDRGDYNHHHHRSESINNDPHYKNTDHRGDHRRGGDSRGDRSAGKNRGATDRGERDQHGLAYAQSNANGQRGSGSLPPQVQQSQKPLQQSAPSGPLHSHSSANGYSASTTTSGQTSPAASLPPVVATESWSTGNDAAVPIARTPGVAPLVPQADTWGTDIARAEWIDSSSATVSVTKDATDASVGTNLKGAVTVGVVPSITAASTPAATASGTTVTGPGVSQVKRTVNYAAAAKAGTSHAQPTTPRSVSQPAPAVGSTPPMSSTTAPVAAPASVSALPPVCGEAEQAPAANASNAAGESADVKKRRNRGGRKHRARLEALRAAQDGTAPNGGNGNHLPANGNTGGDLPDEDDDVEPLAGSVAEASLEPPSNPPNAWAARAAAKEKKEAEEASIASVPPATVSTSVSSKPLPPASLSVTTEPPADKLSLQFGSFSLGTVDWSTSEQQATAKAKVNVAPVVKSSADRVQTSTSAAPPTPAANVHQQQSAGVTSGSNNTIVSSSATDINPATSLPIGPGSVLMGLGNTPPAMAQLGVGGGGFPPGGYGAPNPYGMMLGYTPTGIPGYEGSADLKGMPPGMPFYDPASLQAGLPGAPGKFGTIADMGLLASGAPGSTSKLPGMDMDKNSGPGTQGSLPDMYMMGYPPQNVGYPPLYGFPPNPYTGAMPPGSVPPPGSNPYAYSAYPAQNGPLGGGKYSSNQQQGGRSGFGFDETGGAIGGNPARNNGGLGDSVYMPMPGYLSAHIPDSVAGNVGIGGGAKGLGHDGSFMGGRSNAGSVTPQQGGAVLGQGPNVGVTSQGMSYGNDYSIVNNGAPVVAGGWTDQSRGLVGSGGARDPSGNSSGVPQSSSGSGMYTPAAPPNGYWTQQGGYY